MSTRYDADYGIETKDAEKEEKPFVKEFFVKAHVDDTYSSGSGMLEITFDADWDVNKHLNVIFGRDSNAMHGTPRYPLIPMFLKFSQAKAVKLLTSEKTLVSMVPKTTDDDIYEKMKDKLLEEFRYQHGQRSVIQRDYDIPTEDLDRWMQEAQDAFVATFRGKTVEKTIEVRVEEKVPLQVLQFTFDVPMKNYTKKVDDIARIHIGFDSAIYDRSGSASVHLGFSFFNSILTVLRCRKEKREEIQRWRNDGIREDEKDFDVVGKYEPYPHQWVMYKIMLALDKSLNLSEMGTGKTYAALMTIDRRYKDGLLRKGRVLVVCPKNGVKNWVKEAKIHTPHLEVRALFGSYDARVMQLLGSEENDVPHIWAINYEAFAMAKTDYAKARDDEGTGPKSEGGDGIKIEVVNGMRLKEIKIPFSLFMQARDFDMVIIDECHKIKNPDAKRTGQMISAFSSATYKVAMSGTINANKTHDPHMPMVFLDRAAHWNNVQYGRDGKPLAISTLHDRILRADFDRDGWKYIPKSGTIKTLRGMFEETGVRYEKSECLDLPEKQYQVREIELDPQQMQLYLALQRQYHTELLDYADKGGRISITHVLAMMTKLSECANGWVYDNNGMLVKLRVNPKLDTLCEILDEIGEDRKCVVWAHFKADIHIIYGKLVEIYGADAIGVIHGGGHCSECGSWDRERGALEARFNDTTSENGKKLRFLVCNTSAAGHAIDLIGASYEVYYGNNFVKTDRVQSEDRCHRPGMQDHLTIIDIIATKTVDEAIMEALTSWKSMSIALLEHLGLKPEKYVSVSNVKETPAIKKNGNGNGNDDKEKEKEKKDDVKSVVDVELLHHEIQGPSECLLASYAILAGKTMDEARTWVKEELGREEWFPPTCAEEEKLLTKWMLNLKVVSEIPTMGKGIVSVMWRGNSESHAVAYCDGWVYDPSKASPRNRQEWITDAAERGGYVYKIRMQQDG